MPLMPKMTRKFKIKGQPSERDFNGMNFGRQIDVLRTFQAFMAEAKSVWVSQKRQTFAKAIREAVKLYGMTEYYCQFHDEPMYRDDSFQIFYKS